MKQNNLKNIGVFALCAILTAGVVFGIKFLKYSKLAKTGIESAQQTFIQPTQPEQSAVEPQVESSAMAIDPYVAKGMTADEKAMYEFNMKMFNEIKGDVDSRSAQIKADSDYQKAINPVRKKEQAQKDIENAFHK